MNVLVTGANNTTGRKIIELIASTTSHTAKAVIRKEDQTEHIKKLGGEPILADSEKNIEDILDGIDAIIFAAGSGPKMGPEKTISVDRNCAIRLIDSAKKKGVQHFIMLSSMGSEHPEEGPDNMNHYLHAKHDADVHLVNSGLTYTIVRPGVLSNDIPSGNITAHHLLQGIVGSITRSDVAKVLVSSLDIKETFNQTFEILNGNDPIIGALKALKN